MYPESRLGLNNGRFRRNPGAAAAGGADAFDANRLPYGGTWEGIVGVQDVDPSTYTKHSVLTVNGGDDATGIVQTTATTAQINAALANAPANTYVELEAGTFTITADLFNNEDRKELRGTVDGNGLPATLLNFSSGANHLYLTKGTNWDHYYYADNSEWTTKTLTATPARGATSVTATAALTGGAGGTPTAGGLMIISAPENAPTIDAEDDFSDLFSEGGAARRGWMQIVQMSTVTLGTNTITFWPPVNADYLSGTCQLHFRPLTDQLSYSGLKNLSFKVTNGTGTFTDRIVQFSGNNQCWIDNCFFEGVGGGDNIRVAIQLYMCFNCEVTHSRIWDSAASDSSLYGMNVYGASGLFIANNEFKQIANTCMILNMSGSVFAYNYCHAHRYQGGGGDGFLSQGIFLHGAHSHYNLWEGNHTWHYIDEVGAPNATHSRNCAFVRERLPGWDDNDGLNGAGGTSQNNGCIQLLAHQDNVTVAACVMGTSGKHSTYELLTASESSIDEAIFRIDSTTKTTLDRLGNYNTVTGGIPAAETTELGGNTVATSYFSSSRPSWYGSTLPWPWVTPANVSQSLDTTKMPAGYRSANGTDAA